jgi:hypothetical protein
VEIAFSTPVSAFSTLTWSAHSGEGALMELYNAGTLLRTIALDNGDASFIGFVASGDPVTRVRFRSATPSAGGDEEFGIDDLSLVAVPAPGFGACAGAVVVIRALSRRRRPSTGGSWPR